MKDISKIILTAFISCTLLLGGATAMAQTREAAANTAAQSLFTKTILLILKTNQSFPLSAKSLSITI